MFFFFALKGAFALDGATTYLSEQFYAYTHSSTIGGDK